MAESIAVIHFANQTESPLAFTYCKEKKKIPKNCKNSKTSIFEMRIHFLSKFLFFFKKNALFSLLGKQREAKKYSVRFDSHLFKNIIISLLGIKTNTFSVLFFSLFTRYGKVRWSRIDKVMRNLTVWKLK